MRQNTQELQQATEVARGTAELETAKMNLAYFVEFVRDPALLLVVGRAFSDPETLTPEERAQWSCSMALWFHLAQGHFRQYRRGLLALEAWEPIERGLAGMMRQEVGRQWWTGDAMNIAVLASDFRTHVDELARSYPDEAWVPPQPSDFGKR